MNTIRCAAPLRCVARRTAHTGPACTGLAPRRPAPLARVAQPATGSSSSSSAAARRTAVTAAAMATYEPASSDEALRVVQAQLEAYNARDLEAFMAIMDDNVVALDAETGAVIASNAAELRPRYVERFKTPVHAALLGRLVFSNCVVDRERISGLPGGAVADCMATYFVGSHGKIVKFLMLWRPAA